MSEKLFCDFCQREIDDRLKSLPGARCEVKVSQMNGLSVLLRRDACLVCAQKVEKYLVGLRLEIEP